MSDDWETQPFGDMLRKLIARRLVRWAAKLVVGARYTLMTRVADAPVLFSVGLAGDNASPSEMLK